MAHNKRPRFTAASFVDWAYKQVGLPTPERAATPSDWAAFIAEQSAAEEEL